jgi:phospholipid/cholesterol/gamma-HCH transport system substrate-binding protein
VKRAIRKHLRDFIALTGLFILAIAVAAYVLNEQRLTLPGWVPVIGKSFYVIKGEFSDAQAITPGQGQTVNIAGVKVGEISAVDLKNGRAIVTMELDEKFKPIYRNATMLLRPRTGLQDMTVQLDPGTKDAGELPNEGTIPVAQTKPNVEVDQNLAVFDLDTRRALQFIVNAGGAALDDQAIELRNSLRRFPPTAKYTAELTDALAERRNNLKRVVTNFRRLSGAIANRDRDLATLITASNRVFESLAAENENIRETLGLLPGSLRNAQEQLVKVDALADELGPTAEALRPSARSLGPALEEVRPFLRDTTPVIRDELRPFARQAQPTVRALNSAARALAAAAPDVTSSLKILNYTVDALAYNPPGNEEGYLFWLAWANHLANSLFSGQDAHGPIRRGLVIADCASLTVVEAAGAIFPQAQPVASLSNFPTPQQVGCGAEAEEAGAAGAKDGKDGGDDKGGDNGDSEGEAAPSEADKQQSGGSEPATPEQTGGAAPSEDSDAGSSEAAPSTTSPSPAPAAEQSGTETTP